MIEEILTNEETLDAELRASLLEALATLTIKQKKIIWYWLIGCTQDETSHRIWPGRSRAHVWQERKKAIDALKRELST